jgi:hypothetical protein
VAVLARFDASLGQVHGDVAVSVAGDPGSDGDQVAAAVP